MARGEVDHSKHRQRIKARYMREGVEAFEMHNLLELLLFYSIPQKDTNETAHLLINEFGSLKNVLDAPVDELVNVKGVGEHTAVLLNLCGEIYSAAQMDDAKKNIKRLDSTTAAIDYFVHRYSAKTVELLDIMCLDNSGKIICCKTVAQGVVNSCNVNTRKVIEIIIRSNAATIIIAHNHPFASSQPSVDDVDLTSTIKNLLAPMNIAVRDHVIIGNDGGYSMASQPIFSKMFK